MYDPYKQYLHQLQDRGHYRCLPQQRQPPLKGSYVDFSTNDYLKLSQHPELIKAAQLAAQEYGVGATGSRLLSGNRIIFEHLEQRIATDKGCEAALVLNSGFQTNITILSAMLDQKILQTRPIVFFDKWNHSSLYQAIFLSGAEWVRYHHNNMNHLRECLEKYKNDARPQFIVTETVFGMDGDIVPLHEVVALAREYRTWVYVDEAHAMGVIGKQGYGLSTTVEWGEVPHVVMGTFSKGLGCSGGYIACNQVMKDFLINRSPGFIYSTANSPMVIGAALKAWDMVKNYEHERAQMLLLADILRQKWREKGGDTGASCSHIVPIIVGKPSTALEWHQALWQAGMMTSYIRPPTVPPGTSRLRLALTVAHQKSDIERVVEVLCRFL